MKIWKKMTIFALMLTMCLALTACGDSGSQNDEEDYRVPGMIEAAVYDAAADASECSDFFGVWAGVGDAAGDTLEITPTDGGMYFTICRGEELIASGRAQNVPDYGCIYFFNESDGNAYQFAADYDGNMELYSFGAFAMETSSASTDFSYVVGEWYLDGYADAGVIEIDANGGWSLYEPVGDGGELVLTDYGYLEQDPSLLDLYCARSLQSDGVAYKLETSYEENVFTWGDHSDSYQRSTGAAQENPAKDLGYASIADMRTQEHEVIYTDDGDNTVAEGYWYPNGDRNSLTYFKVQRDVIYWYEFDPVQGDVQVGDPDGVVLKIGSERRLQSGTTFTYTVSRTLSMEDSRICFEGETTEYCWREQ